MPCKEWIDNSYIIDWKKVVGFIIIEMVLRFPEIAKI